MELMEVIKARRSIRKYRQDEVVEEKVEYVLEAARLAPSWKNLQCWQFIVVRSAEGRRALAGAFVDANPGKKALEAAPVVIVLCADSEKSEVLEGKQYYLVDVAIAMEHLVLAAQDKGLGTCWMGLFDEKVMQAALGIPENIRIVAVTPLGYPDQEPSPRPRKDLREIVFREKWGQS
ncbi:MAG: nitroreductase family protein [Thermincolia bacterium]